MPSLVEISPAVLEKEIFKFVNVFSLFRYYLSWKKGGALLLNKIESSSPKDALCQVWLKLVKWFWRRRFFIFVNVFSIFRNHLLFEKDRVLRWNEIKSPSPKSALYEVWFKLPQWFWRRKFFNFVNVFFLSRNYFPLQNDRARHLDKLESPLP